MICIRLRNAGFNEAGEVVHRQAEHHAGYVAFKYPCGKCLPCRLNIAREKALRCVHESRMHKKNCFLTLTYSDEHLMSDRLQYEDYQNFMKSLREHVTRNALTPEEVWALRIPAMVTGEYGEKTKRPHWHILLFNYEPDDMVYLYTSDRGDKLYKSKFIDELWGKNDPKKKPNEIGAITMESAGYVARYAAKKLVHGNDQDHEYHPIHKTSSKYAIGRTWIEKHWKYTFQNGFCVLPNGQQTKIPRYYVDWLKKEKPEEYRRYVTEVAPGIKKISEMQSRKEEMDYISSVINNKGKVNPITRAKVKETILNSKFKQLKEKI